MTTSFSVMFFKGRISPESGNALVRKIRFTLSQRAGKEGNSTGIAGAPRRREPWKQQPGRARRFEPRNRGRRRSTALGRALALGSEIQAAPRQKTTRRRGAQRPMAPRARQQAAAHKAVAAREGGHLRPRNERQCRSDRRLDEGKTQRPHVQASTNTRPTDPRQAPASALRAPCERPANALRAPCGHLANASRAPRERPASVPNP